MEFNINDTVKVKLNDFGRAIHRDNWLASQRVIWERGVIGFPYREPIEDDEGYSKWQMWDLMKQFGSHMYLGGMMPFDSKILIE